MKKLISFIFCLLAIGSVSAQQLPFRMEELTAPDYIKAVEKSSKTCILPIGVFEKHGPHLPLGTDLYTAREFALRAAEKEYTVVFPWYSVSNIEKRLLLVKQVGFSKITKRCGGTRYNFKLVSFHLVRFNDVQV